MPQAFQFGQFGGPQKSRARAHELRAGDRVDSYWNQSVHEGLQPLSFDAFLVKLVDEKSLLERLPSRLVMDLSTNLQQRQTTNHRLGSPMFAEQDLLYSLDKPP